jgi:hypothetical protein
MIKDKPMKKVTLTLDPDDYERFAYIARAKGSDPSKVVRFLIARYLQKIDSQVYESLGRKYEASLLPDFDLEAIALRAGVSLEKTHDE